MRLCRTEVSEVNLHNAGAKGVELDLPSGAVLVLIERKGSPGSTGYWTVTYYTS